MNTDKFFTSKAFKITFIVTVEIIIILLTFRAGMFVGYRRADFTGRWGDNYQMNFGGPQRGFMGMWDDRDLIDSNGTFGDIISINDTEITVKGRDNVEKIITVSNDTVIKEFRDDIKITDLKVGDNIVSIGEPDESGKISAKLIRLMPPPPSDGERAPNPGTTNTNGMNRINPSSEQQDSAKQSPPMTEKPFDIK